jgi:hypothetical protein
MTQSEYAKAKSYAEATKTEILNFFILDADDDKGNNAELKEIALIELGKRQCPKYCKGMNF